MGAVVVLTAAPAAAHPLHASSGPVRWPEVLGHSVLGTAFLWVTLPLAGLLLASLWAPRGPRLESSAWDALLGAALVVAVALLRGGRGLGPLAFTLILVHLGTAAVWIGGLLELIVRGDDRWTAARRFGPVGLGAAIVLVVTGVWNVHVHTGGRPLAGSYEHVLAFKLSLVAGAVVFGAVAHRRVRGRRAAPTRRLVGGEMGVLATVLAAAAVLTALPAATAVGPKVRVERTGARVTVASAGRSFTAAGSDAEECASHGTGVLLAGGDPRRLPCSTADALAPQLGKVFATFLGANNVKSVIVVADPSARSQQMTQTLVAVGGAAGIHFNVVFSAADVQSWDDAVVLTSGWSTAASVLAAIDGAATPPVRGAFLAPWLLSSAVTGGPGRVQLAVALPFDPSGSAADAYLAQLARRTKRGIASAAGFEGWLAGRRSAQGAGTAVEFFTPARIEFLPPSLSAGHDDLAGPSWVAGGRLAAVSGLIRLDA